MLPPCGFHTIQLAINKLGDFADLFNDPVLVSFLHFESFETISTRFSSRFQSRLSLDFPSLLTSKPRFDWPLCSLVSSDDRLKRFLCKASKSEVTFGAF